MAVQAPASVNSSTPAVLAEPSSVPASSVVLAKVAGVVDTLITSVVSPGAQGPSPIVDGTTVPIPVDEHESYFDVPVPPFLQLPKVLLWWGKSVLVVEPFLVLNLLHLTCRLGRSLFFL